MKPFCLHRFETIGSTNDEAMRLLRGDAPDGTLVWAERQTGGKGRMGRGWDSPPGNLYLSVVRLIDLEADLAGRIAVSCGRIVASALRVMTDLPVCTKWPNDLYLEGRKLGGILVETRLAPGGRICGAVAGLGLNVASHPDIPALGHPATHLADHGIHANVVGTLLEPLAFALWGACGHSSSENWLRDISATNELEALGAARVRQGEEEYDAEAVGVESDGALVLRREGKLQRVRAGEVTVRPATFPSADSVV